MDFDFPLTIIVESGQRDQSSAAHHPSSMVRDSVSITRETPASWNPSSQFARGKDENGK